MATVTLDDGWFHLADDLSTFVTFGLTSLQVGSGRTGEVRNYAGGRRRVVVGPARPVEFQVVCRFVDRDDVAVLAGWAGRVLQFRDPLGRVETVTFLGWSETEPYGPRDVVDLELTLQTVSS